MSQPYPSEQPQQQVPQYPPPQYAAASQHPAPAQRQPSPKKRRKWPWIVGGVFALLIIIVTATSNGSNKSSSSANGALSTAAGTTAAIPAAATTQPPPTTTTTPPAPPTVIHGRGDDVLPVTRTGPKIVEFDCPACSSNTVLQANGADSLLVNTIGAYSGMHWMDVEDTSVTSQLTVQANSSWTITIGGMDLAVHANGPISGHGDTVVIDTASSNNAAITNQGSSNFVVQDISDSSGENLVVNDIGGYSGTDPLTMPGIIQVTSDGAWSITPN